MTTPGEEQMQMAAEHPDDADRDPSASDPWARWILHHRHGGDPATKQRMLTQLAAIRDQVLRNARITPGQTVLDIGCGDGLLGITALGLVGERGKVIFSDISTDLLTVCQNVVSELGHTGRAEFVHTGLPDLDAIPTASAHAAMTRSVLIYVPDRAASFAAMHRILRPGGRISIFEPINSFSYPEPPHQLWGFNLTDLQPIAAKVKDTYQRHLGQDNPLTDFDERDLLAACEQAGFIDIELNFRVEIRAHANGVQWEDLLRQAPNPLVPPLGHILDNALTTEEHAALAAHIRAQIAAGRRQQRNATLYLTATK